jgi:hypothetical protein
MLLEEVIKFYGSKRQISKECDIALSSPHVWAFRGFIPIKAQHKIELKSGGKLKADYEHARSKCC